VAASRPSITDIKLLFARSGNRCAFPKCRAPLAINNSLIGEVCHIKGNQPDSARHDPNQTNEERHAYANLILMCRIHHTVIDDDEETYTVERLYKLKAAHESQSAPMPNDQVIAVAEQFIQSVTNFGQSGGLSAHTVNASTINVQGGPSTNHLTHQRQIEAVENLWQVVRKLSSEFSLVVFVDTILTSQELDAYFSNGEHPHIADCIREYTNMNTTLHKLANAGANEATKERPFVTHRLWSIFCVVQGIYGRAALMLTNSYKEGKFVNWREDSGCEQLLRAVLPARAIEQAKEREIGGLRIAIDYLESEFLAEAGLNKPQV
jgi:hypothetical protein